MTPASFLAAGHARNVVTLAKDRRFASRFGSATSDLRQGGVRALPTRPPQLPIPQQPKINSFLKAMSTLAAKPWPSPPGRTRRVSLDAYAASRPGIPTPHWPAFTPPLTHYKSQRQSVPLNGYGAL